MVSSNTNTILHNVAFYIVRTIKRSMFVYTIASLVYLTSDLLSTDCVPSDIPYFPIDIIGLLSIREFDKKA